MKTTRLLVAMLLTMMISLGVKAQDKYEFATVVYDKVSNSKAFITISIVDKYEERAITPPSGHLLDYNLTPVLSEINKMSSEGWEVYNNNVITVANDLSKFVYYLRKKKS